MDDFDFSREDFRNKANSIALPILFFRSVVNRLDKTIDQTNQELRVRYPGPWESQKQIVRLTFGLGKRIELGYGRTRCCTFALTGDNSHIEALITDETESPDSSGVKLLAFLLESKALEGKLGVCDPGGPSKNAEAAVKAYRMDLEPLEYRLHEIGPQEIAETVVAGIVRGYF